MTPPDSGHDFEVSAGATRSRSAVAEPVTLPTLPALHASRWALGGQVGSQVISLLVLAFLYRWVSPQAFGLAAFALAWVSLFRGLATLSWQAWLIQQPHWTDGELSRLFVGNLRVSVAAMLVCMSLGAMGAAFSHVAGLAVVIAGLSPTIVLSTLATFAQALHERRLQWRTLTCARVAAQGIAGMMAVGCAWMGWGVVALVAQPCVEFGMLAWLLWRCEPWRPQWQQGARLSEQVWHFQGWYALASLLFLAIQQIDTLLLGIWIGHSATGRALLGMYGQAYQLSQRPTSILTGAWGSVLLASLARGEPTGRSGVPIVQYFFGMTSLLLMPIGVAGIYLGPDLMQVLGGETWRTAGELLRIFAVMTLWQGIVNLVGNLFTVRGATRAMACGAGCGALGLGLGTLGACWANAGRDETHLVQNVAATYVVVFAVWSIPYLLMATRVAQIPWQSVGQALGPSLAAGGVMALVLALVGNACAEAPPLTRLAWGMASGGLGYGLAVLATRGWNATRRRG